MKNRTPQPQSNSVAVKFGDAMALPFRFLNHLFALLIDLMINLPVMNAVWRERRELELLIDIHTKDIGLTPDCVRREMRKGFFDIPHNRKRSYRSANTACYISHLRSIRTHTD